MRNVRGRDSWPALHSSAMIFITWPKKSWATNWGARNESAGDYLVQRERGECWAGVVMVIKGCSSKRDDIVLINK